MKVFIGVPVYNGEKYLRECLDSIMNQVFTDWVCYISNNHSKDNSDLIISDYCKKDSRFIAISPPVFVSAWENCNFLFSHITSEYKYAKIAAADDWLFPMYLKELTNVGESESDIGLLSSYRLDGNDVNCFGLNIYDGNIFYGKSIIEYMLCGGNGLTGSMHNVLYNVSFLKEIDLNFQVFNVSNIHADTELAYAICDISKFGFVYQVLSYTRRHNETGTSKALRLNTYLNCLEILYNKYSTYNNVRVYQKNFYRSYSIFLLKQYLKLDFEPIRWHKKRMLKKISFLFIIYSLLYKIFHKIPKIKNKTNYVEAGW